MFPNTGAQALSAVAILALAPLACAQSPNTDLPVDLQFVAGSAVPQQQWPGDITQIYEPYAQGTSQHFVGCTNALQLSTGSLGVWGHDEGPSVLFPSPDGRILWYWGDSVTAYQTSFTNCTTASGGSAYQVNTCTQPNGVMDTCLGVDTVSFVDATSVTSGLLWKCSYLADLDRYLINGGTSPTYGTSNCAKTQYISDSAHTGSIPKAGFTYQHAGTLATNESMLAGHTASGLFSLPDVSGNNHLYVVYDVLSQDDAGFNFRTRSILLRMSGDSSTITASQMPDLSRLYTLSQAQTPLPTGTAYVVNNTTNMTATVYTCGAAFDSGWATGSLWQGMLFSGQMPQLTYPVTSVAMDLMSLTIKGNVPSAVSNCVSPLTFDVVPNQDASTGKFIFASPELISAATISARNLGPLMPWLTPGDPALCFWGSSFYYRNSNVYLGCMDGTDANVQSGISAMNYFTGYDTTGRPQWATSAEASASPLLSSWTHNTTSSPETPCVGELSVRWIQPLSRFLLTYGSYNCGGLWYRSAQTPWGPWSAEFQFFPNDYKSGWEQKLIYFSVTHNPVDFNKDPSVYLTDPNTTGTINLEGKQPYDQVGNAYGPYQFPGTLARDYGNGTVGVLMNMSGFNPYVSWQMQAKFYKPSGVGVSGHVLFQPKIEIVH